MAVICWIRSPKKKRGWSGRCSWRWIWLPGGDVGRQEIIQKQCEQVLFLVFEAASCQQGNTETRYLIIFVSSWDVFWTANRDTLLLVFCHCYILAVCTLCTLNIDSVRDSTWHSPQESTLSSWNVLWQNFIGILSLLYTCSLMAHYVIMSTVLKRKSCSKFYFQFLAMFNNPVPLTASTVILIYIHCWIYSPLNSIRISICNALH